MAGNKAGGVKARNTNYMRHGKDFYKRIGAKGGRNGRGPNYKGGFAISRELASRAGALGGKASKRGDAHYYILVKNSRGEVPTFEVRPRTAQSWRRFMKAYLPKQYNSFIESAGSAKTIIERLEKAYKIQFKEVKKNEAN